MARTSIVETGVGQLVMPLPFEDGEYVARLNALRRLMAKKGIDYFISFTPENLYYLTNHDTPGYYYLQACVVGHSSDPIVLTRKIESFNTLGRGWKRLVVPYLDTENPVDKLLLLLDELGIEGKQVGIETDAWFITSRQFIHLSEGIRGRAEMVDASGLVEELRTIKSAHELNYIREAGKICSAAMHVCFDASHDGANENTVAAATMSSLVGQGSEYAGLPPFISTGPKTTLVHSTWAGREMRFGDVLAYELPAVRARYCCALYRTGVIGKASSEIVRGCDVLVETLEALLAAIKPGRPINEVHQASVEIFRKNKMAAAPRRSAYALGINYPPDWGEGHIVSFTDKETRILEPGMVFHVGTGIYDYPNYQLAFTESIAVTVNGYELLTEFARELVVR